MNFEPENWTINKRILVILAHPDDPDFFCGAMLSRWCQQGHEVHYCLLTKGQKGGQDVNINPDQLGELRVLEQEAAAKELGVKSVEFLDYVDGEVIPDLAMRKKIVRVIRKWKPEILVTCDPLNLFPNDSHINHPDHRAAGQVVVDAAFPASGSAMFFPELIRDENLAPHSVEEIWLSATSAENISVDLTDYFDSKLRAIYCHRSQIDVPLEQFDAMMRQRFITDPVTKKEVFYEQFRRIKFL
jgi:LmbE family N-acetylglucosaminyl deacetylase